MTLHSIMNDEVITQRYLFDLDSLDFSFLTNHTSFFVQKYIQVCQDPRKSVWGALLGAHNETTQP